MKKLYPIAYLIDRLTTRVVNKPYSENLVPEKIMIAAILVAIIGLLAMLYINNFYSLPRVTG